MAFWDRLLGRTPNTTPQLAAAAGGPVPSSPPVGRVAAREAIASNRYGNGQRLANNEAIDATIQSVTQVFDEAQRGNTARLIDLYKSSRVHDDRLDSACATRVMAIQGRGYVLKAPPNLERDPDAIAIAKWATARFNEVRGLKTLIGHLAHGHLEHLAVLQHQWSRDRAGHFVTQPRWEHPNRFGWRLPDVTPSWSTRELGDHAGKLLADYPDRFIVHAPVAGRSDYPWMRGAMRARIAPSVVKRMGFRWWLKMLERWGQPQVYAIRPEETEAGDGTGTGTGDELQDALRGISSQWFATVPKGTEIESIPVTVLENLHRQFIEYQDTSHSIAILGQNLSTEISKGGSYAAAKAHQLVRMDILISDLEELAETITDQWVEPLVRYNFGLDAPVPYFDFVLGARSEITVEAYQAGLFSTDEVRASMGYDPEEDGRGRRYFVPPATTPGALPAPSPDAEAIDVDVVVDAPTE